MEECLMDKKIRVLVIDDSPFILKAVKKALEPQGIEIIGHAENGKLGLEMVDSHKPDVITLDVTMPVMDGLETASNLFAKDSQVKVIMLSAMGDEELLQTAKNIGVRHFLSKPFKPDALISAVKNILAEV
jgi:two-component system, chemotaxis family, chemotaxis protein CheY